MLALVNGCNNLLHHELPLSPFECGQQIKGK